MSDTGARQLYGIAAADAPPPTMEENIEIEQISHRQLAALVRTPADRPRRQELLDHSRVLDAAAGHGPVVPVRFCTVLPSASHVIDQVLAPHHDRLTAALAQLRGTAQFTLRARYVESEIMREVLSQEPQVRRMHEKLQRRPGGPDQAGRVRLGQLLAGAVASRRQTDAEMLAATVRHHVSATVVRLPRAVGGQRVADAAYLVPLPQRDEFEHAVHELAQRWHGRVQLRLLGPMAPYDFVAGPAEAMADRRG